MEERRTLQVGVERSQPGDLIRHVDLVVAPLVDVDGDPPGGHGEALMEMVAAAELAEPY
ncbi:MAG TPA: hypothetical protein VEK76_03875 [Candidatus Binatia bacterium]|nr:hypothetical protein [Candidatus Binatia bacterium]